MQQLAFSLTRNVFPLVPVQKIWAKPRAAKFWEETRLGDLQVMILLEAARLHVNLHQNENLYGPG